MTDILVVEDDEAIANLICVSLSAEGYRCTCARDGMEGADYIERQSFDLVLLDIMLPEVDGYELLEYIKPTGTPVIFLTAKGSGPGRTIICQSPSRSGSSWPGWRPCCAGWERESGSWRWGT